MPRTGISADSYGQWEQIANTWDNQLADSLRQVRQDAVQQAQLAQQARNDQLNMLSMAANLRRQREMDAQNNNYRRMQLAASYGRRNDSDMLQWLKFAQEMKKDARTERYYDYLKQLRAEEDNRKRLLAAQKDVFKLGMDANTAAMSHGITDPQTLRELAVYANQIGSNWMQDFETAKGLAARLNELPNLKELVDPAKQKERINALTSWYWPDALWNADYRKERDLQANQNLTIPPRVKELESLVKYVSRDPGKYNVRYNPNMTWEAIPPPNFTATVDAPNPQANQNKQPVFDYEIPPGPKGRRQLLPDLTNKLWHYWDGEKWTYNVGESFVPEGFERAQ